MGQAKLKLEKYDYTQVREIKEASEQSIDMKNVRVAGIVKSLEYRPSQKDVYFYWIEIIDDLLPSTTRRLSLSARRAWIEISVRSQPSKPRRCRSPQGERG